MPNSYVRNPINVIELILIVMEFVSLILNSIYDHNALRILQNFLEVLHPIRYLKYISGYRIQSLLTKSILYRVISVIVLLFWLFVVFSVVGVKFFYDKLGICLDQSKQFENCRGDFLVVKPDNYGFRVYQQKRVWTVPSFNYSNIIQGLMSLFISTTGQLWTKHLKILLSSIYEHELITRRIMSVYYAVTVILFQNFVYGAISALFVAHYQTYNNKLVTLDYMRFIVKYAMCIKPKKIHISKYYHTYEYYISLFIQHRFTKFLIDLCIIGNMILVLTVMTNHLVYPLLHGAISIIFVTEIIMKIFTFKKLFFKSIWNIYHFVATIGNIIELGLIIHAMIKKVSYSIIILLQILTILRLLKIISYIPIHFKISIRLLTRKLIHFVGMYFVFITTFIVIGKKIFYMTDTLDSLTLENNLGFKSSLNSILTLLKTASLDDWHNIVCSFSHPNKCIEHITSSCGSALSIIYFLFFVLISIFIFKNLYLSILIDTTQICFESRDNTIVKPIHLHEFLDLWAKFDPDATGKIKHSCLFQIISNLPYPLGAQSILCNDLSNFLLLGTQIPVEKDGYVYFRKTLFWLVWRNFISTPKFVECFKEGEQYYQSPRDQLRILYPNMTDDAMDNYFGHDDTLHMGKVAFSKILYTKFKNITLTNKCQGNITTEPLRLNLKFFFP